MQIMGNCRITFFHTANFIRFRVIPFDNMDIVTYPCRLLIVSAYSNHKHHSGSVDKLKCASVYLRCWTIVDDSLCPRRVGLTKFTRVIQRNGTTLVMVASISLRAGASQQEHVERLMKHSRWTSMTLPLMTSQHSCTYVRHNAWLLLGSGFV